jgi:formiminotetrahydrofolate cyclodeaminase
VDNDGVTTEGGTLRELLDGIASPSPSGGGGAAAALAGATAAALVGMVAGVAAARAPEDADLREIVGEAEALRKRMLALIECDVAAFGRVVEARRRTDDGRATAVRDALIGATEVPMELASASARVLGQCMVLLPRARPSTVPDLGVAATLAAAALEGAAITARANLDTLDAPAFVAESRRRLDGWLREAADLRSRLPRAHARTTR